MFPPIDSPSDVERGAVRTSLPPASSPELFPGKSFQGQHALTTMTKYQSHRKGLSFLWLIKHDNGGIFRVPARARRGRNIPSFFRPSPVFFTMPRVLRSARMSTGGKAPIKWRRPMNDNGEKPELSVGVFTGLPQLDRTFYPQVPAPFHSKEIFCHVFLLLRLVDIEVARCVSKVGPISFRFPCAYPALFNIAVLHMSYLGMVHVYCPSWEREIDPRCQLSIAHFGNVRSNGRLSRPGSLGRRRRREHVVRIRTRRSRRPARRVRDLARVEEPPYYHQFANSRDFP